MSVVPVLLIGGVGSRLWPMSSPSKPKQFHRLTGGGSMVQETMTRLAGLGVAPPIVVCNQDHVEVAIADLARIGVDPRVVIAEPVGRSTGPAVLLAALVAAPDDVLLVLPADHVIADVAGFVAGARRAVTAAEEGAVVTFGIVPTRPETGYGYIRPGAARDGGFSVVEFVEKPDPERAARFVGEGMVWNSGMFCFRASIIREEFTRHVPEVAEAVMAGFESGKGDHLVFRPGSRFGDAPTISLDHAIMEHTERAVVVPIDVGWSDVGSWETLYELGSADPDGNVVVGDRVITVGVDRSYIRSGDRPVAVIGLSDVIVVDSPEGVLVVARDRAQDVKLAAEAATRSTRS